jgi:prepilin-type N-terminal cleavage/methylation domain-containing protein
VLAKLAHATEARARLRSHGAGSDDAAGRARPADPTGSDSADAGFTLTELLVSMSILAIIIAIFVAAMAQEYKDSVRTESVSAAADQSLQTMDRFDHSIRYAGAVNWPVEVGTNWYLEYQTTARKNGAQPLCTQWKFNSTADTIAYRTWVETGGTVTPTAFVTTSTNVVNNPTTQQPFTFYPADPTYTNQRVTLNLIIKNSQGNGATIQTTFTALNTTTATVTNTDAQVAGVSDTQVCQEAGRP